MRHYPAYTVDAVLREPAIRVFMLIEHAIRFDASEMSRQLNLAQASGAAPSDLQQLKDALERQQSDILEDESPENDYSAIKKLRAVFNEKPE